MESILNTPSWAYDFCYYYAFVAAIVVVSVLWSLVKLNMLPTVAKKLLPMTSITVTMLLSALVIVVLTMMQFWICRGALNPAKKTEKFAVTCQNGVEDCTAVMGTPQGPDCTCGARGLCGGCVMQNNMQPVSGGLEGF